MKLDEFTEKIDEAMGFVQKLPYQEKKAQAKAEKVKSMGKKELAQDVNEPKNIEKALKMFMKGAQKLIDDDYRRNYTKLKPPKLEIKKGGRYYKVIRKEQSGSGGSVHAFIDGKEGPTYGDILKPASYKAPAKHARGNLFDGSWGLKYMSAYGPAYMR